jgi:cytochrome c oxidase subunit 2
MPYKGFWTLGVIGICILLQWGTSFSFAEGSWSHFYQPPENISGDFQIDSIINKTTLLAGSYFLVVVVSLLYFCVRYRDKKDGRRGFYHHGTDKMSLLVQLLVGLLVFFTVDVHLVYLSSKHLQTVFYNFPQEDPKDEKTLRVEVYPQQWAWNFRYAGPDALFNTEDDILTFNEMFIPKDKNVFVQLKAKDVIHSFSLPHTRLKQDVIPGAISRMWFKSEKAGEFPIVCAEMCGPNHYKMKAKLFVLEENDYKTWAARATKLSKADFNRTEQEKSELLWGWNWEPYAPGKRP